MEVVKNLVMSKDLISDFLTITWEFKRKWSTAFTIEAIISSPEFYTQAHDYHV